MKLKRLAILFLLVLSVSPFAWAKKHNTTPTDTPTATATDTPTPTPTVVIWTGTKLYAFDAMWGSKGSGLDQLNDPEAIDVMPDGRMIIADTGNNRILVWDTNGHPVGSYGTFGSRADWRNPPQFNHPAGVLAYPSGQIYVSDTLNHRIVVLDNKGLVVQTWGSQGPATQQFNQPRTVAKDHFGNIWVLDTGNSRVQTFSGLGVFNSAWGAFGTDPASNTITATMNLPMGMAVNQIDQAIVADTGNFKMQVFNTGGVPVTAVGWYGDGPFQFKDPLGATVTPSGMAAIADGTSGRIIFYNSRNGDFEIVSQWKGREEIQKDNYDPKFCGIASDSQNRLYITDVNSDCVIRLVPLKYQVTPTVPTPTPVPPDTSPYGGNGFPIR